MKTKRFHFWSLLTLLAFSITAIGCSDDDDPVVPAPEPSKPVLQVESATIETAATAGECTMNFVLTNPAEGNVLASASVDWIDGISVEQASRADIGGEMQHGKVKFSVKENASAEAREGKITLTYPNAADAQFTVRQLVAGDEPAPELNLNAHAGDKEGNNGSSTLTFMFSSEQAVAAKYATMDSAKLAGTDLEAFVNEMGEDATKEMIKAANEGDCEIVVTNLQADNAYTFVCEVKAENGKKTLKSIEAKTLKGGEPQPGAFDVRCEGWAGNAMKNYIDVQVTFNLQCSVAKAGSYVIYTTADADAALSKKSILDLLNTDGTAFPEEYILDIMTDMGTMITATDLTPETSYTFLYELRNAAGEQVWGRCDAATGKISSSSDPDGPQVIAESWAGDKNKQKVSQAFTFKVQSPEATYFKFGLFTKADVDEYIEQGYVASLEELINGFAQSILEPMELDELRGKGYYVVNDGAYPSTSYSLVYLAMNEAGKSTYGRCDVTTKAMGEGEGDAPVIELRAVAGDADGNHTDTAITVAFKCTSQDAMAAKCSLYPTAKLDETLAQMSLEDIILNYGTALAEDHLLLLNGEGYTISVSEGIEPDHSYSFVGLALNANNKYSVGRKDVRTTKNGESPAPQPEPSGDLDLQFTAQYDQSADMVRVEMKCLTQNADKGYIGTLLTSQVDKIISENGSLENYFFDLAIPYGATYELSAANLADANASGFQYMMGSVEGLEKEIDYTLVGIVTNPAGARCLKTAQVMYGNESGKLPDGGGDEPGGETGEGPTLELMVLSGNMEQTKFGRAICFGVACTSADATAADYMVYMAADVDGAINGAGFSLEQILDALGTTKIEGRDLDAMNGQGFIKEISQGITPQTDYAVIVRASNAKGKTIVRKDVNSSK